MDHGSFRPQRFQANISRLTAGARSFPAQTRVGTFAGTPWPPCIEFATRGLNFWATQVDLAAWLSSLGLGSYAEAFRANDIEAGIAKPVLPALHFWT